MTISTLVTVWCDGDECEAYTDGSTQAKAIHDARAEGWKVGKCLAYCPDCRPALAEVLQP